MTQSLSQSDVTLGPFSRLFIFKECDGLTSDFNVEICEIKRYLRKVATQQINCPVALVMLGSFNNLCEDAPRMGAPVSMPTYIASSESERRRRGAAVPV